MILHVDPGLHEMSAEGMPERVRRDPAPETGGIGGGVAGAIELAVRDRQQGIPAREQPALRAALLPPGAKDREQLLGEHSVPVLASLALLDADQHPFAVDIAHAQSDNLGAAQSGAVGHTQRGLVFEARSRRSLQQAGHILRREHARQLPRIVDAGELVGEIEAAERDLEKEAQSRDLSVHLRRLRALLDLMHLEPAQVLRRRRVRRAAEKDGEGLDVLDVIVLCLLAEAADGHVLQHAAA